MRQDQRLRRHPLGARRAERQAAPRRLDGRRDLQRLPLAQAHRHGRGPRHVQERERNPPHRLLRSHGVAPGVPLGGVGVLPQPDPVPPQGRARPVLRHRHGKPRLFGDRAGDGGPGAVRQLRPPPVPVRGGVRHHEVQVAQEGGAGQARRHRGRPHAPERHRVRDRARAALARAPGRQGAPLPAPARPDPGPRLGAHREAGGGAARQGAGGPGSAAGGGGAPRGRGGRAGAAGGAAQRPEARAAGAGARAVHGAGRAPGPRGGASAGRAADRAAG